MDDFEDGNIEGWTLTYGESQATNYLTVEPANGQLRIQGARPGEGCRPSG